MTSTVAVLRAATILAAFALSIGGPAVALGRDLTAAEQALIEAAVRKELSNPASARFKWMPIAKDGDLRYCALVDAKNRAGFYVGDLLFEATLTWRNGVLVEAAFGGVGSPNPNDARTINMTTLCAEAGYRDLTAAH